MEAVHGDNGEVPNSPKGKDVEKVIVDQADDTSTLISEDKNNDSVASNIMIPQVNSLSHMQISENTASEHATVVVDKVEVGNNGTFETEKHVLSIEKDGVSNGPIVGSYAHEDEGCGGGEVDEICSTCITTNTRKVPDSHSGSCLGSALVKKNRVSLNNICEPLTTEAKRNNLTAIPTSGDISGKQSRYHLSPNAHSTVGKSIEKDDVNGFAYNIEKDADEQLNDTIISTIEDTAVNGVPVAVRNVCSNMKADARDTEMRTSCTQEQDVCNHPCEVDEDLRVEFRENYTGKRFIENSLHPQESSVPQMKRELSAEERNDVEKQGFVHVIDAEPEKADKGSMKNTEEHEGLAVEPNYSVKQNEKAKRNKMLKSVAAAMTLLGAIFFVHHIRQNKGRESDNKTVKARRDQNLRHEAPMQKRVEVGKSDVLYPGGRLKF